MKAYKISGYYSLCELVEEVEYKSKTNATILVDYGGKLHRERIVTRFYHYYFDRKEAFKAAEEHYSDMVEIARNHLKESEEELASFYEKYGHELR